MLTRRDLFLAAGAISLAPGRASASERERPLLVSVLTCPRPGGVSYLDGTLAAVDAELPGVRKLVIYDGGAPAERDGWTVATYPARPPGRNGYHDNREPAWVAIWAAFSSGSDLLFLEDDIRPIAPGAFAAMAQHEVDHRAAAFTSFYHRNRAPGLYDAAAFHMSQAVLIPWRRLVLLWAQRNELRYTTWVDLAIAEVGRRAGWKFEQTAPLVSHVGTVSAAMPGHRWEP